MKFEQLETYLLAGIGLARGIGALILAEVTDRIIIPKGLRSIDMESFNQMITETAEESK